MIETRTSQLSATLEKIAAAIDLPEELYARAYKTYQEVGEWLCDPESSLVRYEPRVYIQGSIRLGTANRPLFKDEEVDVDAVALLHIRKGSTTQKELKDRVGDRLKENEDYRAILENKRRCWTLDYPDYFHMDVLPAIPDEEGLPEAILITDKELRYWQFSNPIGFADWFMIRMAVQFKEARAALAFREFRSVEDVPDYRVKTPLQKSVQLLKRHRDIYFQDDPEDKPVSIAMTTLAARAYGGESDLLEVFTKIALTMRHHIKKENGKYVISNPVQPDENFADKWEQYPERQERFFEWLDQLEADVKELAKIQGLHNLGDQFKRMFGERAAVEVFQKLGVELKQQRVEGKLNMTAGAGVLGATGQVPVKDHNFHGEKVSSAEKA